MYVAWLGTARDSRPNAPGLPGALLRQRRYDGGMTDNARRNRLAAVLNRLQEIALNHGPEGFAEVHERRAHHRRQWARL